MSKDEMETTTEKNSAVVENTIMAQEFIVPPRKKKNTRIEINGIVFNNFFEMVEWITKASKQIEELKDCLENNYSKWEKAE